MTDREAAIRKFRDEAEANDRLAEIADALPDDATLVRTNFNDWLVVDPETDQPMTLSEYLRRYN